MKARDLSLAACAVLAAAVVILGVRHLGFIFAQGEVKHDVEAPSPATVSGSGRPSVVEKGFVRKHWTPVPAISAHAALVADLATGETLMNVNPGLRWPAASLTKIVAADIFLSGLDLATPITLTRSDLAVGGNALTQDLRAGETYKAGELLRIMLISSSNEAAEALARVYGRERLIADMNARAASWGLRDTRFADPSGISADNRTTAEEWKELVRRVRASHPEVFAITRSPSVTVVEVNSGVSRTFLSTNSFAGTAEFLGGKTGTTPEAEENLLSLWNAGGRPVMIIVFGSKNRFVETSDLLTWFTNDFDASD